MAFTKLKSYKIASVALKYASKSALVVSGYCGYSTENDNVDFSNDLDITDTIQRFKNTRLFFGKNDGVQSHGIIQSFHDDENITVENANKIGLELALRVAKGYEIQVYTHYDPHNDIRHIHNHILINSVHSETGKKYQSNRKDLFEIQKISNEISTKYNLELSFVEKGFSKSNKTPIVYTRKEEEARKKGKILWKDILGEAADVVSISATNFEEYKSLLLKNHKIIVDDKGKHVTYRHEDMKKPIRANKMGSLYEREGIENATRANKERLQWQRIKPTNIAKFNADRLIQAVISNARTAEIERQQKLREKAERLEQFKRESERKNREIAEPKRCYGISR